ncbi:glycosyltransferase family 4 protein [Tenacibaculum maritimum]|uniref:glycosyltransferase family 4 protein n=1 Tax=Tenacibaculum maritimum TaxID=107401 RepID=UPI0012E49B74|nr:glycosyltransferase family 4 protein [Tenacibaculum maritimum]MCD9581673.1 glycosyltransferase family 4 protein [Tenacibaculum maritimum]MCD9636201.1 glycosyltransferase family 4 protein [Tenacibaculum maritimum]CAA0189638.1 Glycosyl transferase [Tenacibaculum maritimum]CAA0191824.1 Glycosyl transferase [Tenacibaculum maritimum]
MGKRIIHLTSAHNRRDTRIFEKECKGLTKLGHEVSMVVADGLGNEIIGGIEIYDVGKLPGRINRFIRTTRLVFDKAIDLKGDIYHLHDPELMPIGVKLKRLNKKVIFDAHEDLPKQILAKPYLNKISAKFLAFLISRYEKKVFKKFDFIIAATPYIRDKILEFNKNCIDVNNYPILEEFSVEKTWDDKEDQVCYVGGISKVRGISELVKSLNYVENTHLALAGNFSGVEFEKEVKNCKSWGKVVELGYLNRQQVASVYSKSKAGLVTLHPIVNYLDSLPVKMFEYMAAGIPVIASDFKLWQEIIYENKCGICVNPLEPKSIAKAINDIVLNPKEAEIMGRNGRAAVENKYNWRIEMKKLSKVYNKILK